MLSSHKVPCQNKTPDYTISIAAFEAQLKWLADKGYNTITPEQWFDHITQSAPLPSLPIMLTFDDTHLEHFTVAGPLLKQYDLKGVFFIMTIAIDKKTE
jgi:peptidoglycan/xylan/chitin deacetylase (PgdA/CDA1 family)